MKNAINIDPQDLTSMIEIMDKYHTIDTMFTGENERGEYITVSVFKDRIVTVTYQKNGWERVNTYWRDGKREEIFRGKEEAYATESI